MIWFYSKIVHQINMTLQCVAAEFKGHYVVLEIQNIVDINYFNIYNINDVMIWTQRYLLFP